LADLDDCMHGSQEKVAMHHLQSQLGLTFHSDDGCCLPDRQ